MCSYARKKRRRIGLGLKKGRGREVEGGWKGLDSSTCFLQAAYRAPFSSQHAGGSYVLRPCVSYALPRPFSCIPLPSLASGLQHSTVVSAALHSQTEADKSMLAFNLTQPRERRSWKKVVKREKMNFFRFNLVSLLLLWSADCCLLLSSPLFPPFYLVSLLHSRRVFSNSLSLLAFYIVEEKPESYFSFFKTELWLDPVF